MSQVEHGPARRLKGFQTRIKIGGLLIEMLNPRTQLAQFSNPARVILKNVANGIGRRLSGRIELCRLDQVRGD